MSCSSRVKVNPASNHPHLLALLVPLRITAGLPWFLVVHGVNGPGPSSLPNPIPPPAMAIPNPKHWPGFYCHPANWERSQLFENFSRNWVFIPACCSWRFRQGVNPPWPPWLGISSRYSFFLQETKIKTQLIFISATRHSRAWRLGRDSARRSRRCSTTPRDSWSGRLWRRSGKSPLHKKFNVYFQAFPVEARNARSAKSHVVGHSKYSKSCFYPSVQFLWLRIGHR